MHVKILQKNFVEKVWPANLALFVYVSTHYIATVKYTTQHLLRITFSTVCYFCVFVINMKIDLKELNIISAS